MKKAWLILQDGTKFEGYSFGADGDVTGEVVFATNMTGFQESLTDPNCQGQILVQTFPTVGNVGINEENSISEKNAAGLIVREYCDEPSNFREKGTLGEFMKQRGITGLCGIDTRKLTRHLREHGSMPGTIQLTIDNGQLTINEPMKIDFTEIYANEIAQMKKRTESNETIFASEQEHLFLAAAMGCEIYKMKTGHRGNNQPVIDLRTGKIHITRQNHGYAVKSVPADVGEVILENVNDRTIEGIKYKNIPAVSVQFNAAEVELCR
ncbi:MAG: hypothetical protein FWD34_07890 [Oscillospiraceae bacterium]|nr:hypothetical protein [Oscillospiraceae bacterium]